MKEDPLINDIYLSAQSLCDHLIRTDDILEPYSRIGFMASEICLIMLEDTNLPTSEVSRSIANVFQKLSTETLKENSPDAENLANTFRQCEVASVRLAQYINECRKGTTTASRHQ